MTTTAITLKGDPQIFKVGATVTAYLRSNWPTFAIPPSGAPRGSSAASATVASDGTIALTGLTAGGKYFAVVDLDPSGSHDYHYMQFTVGDSTDLDPNIPVAGDVVTGPASATSNDFATYNGTTGKVIKDSGLALDTTGTLGTSDAKVPSQKAVKTYADALAALIDTRYRTIQRISPRVASSVNGAGDYICQPTSVSPQNANNLTPLIFYLDSADQAGLLGTAAKLRIVAGCLVNDTAPGVTLKVGLYPVGTPSGGVGVFNPNLGSVIAASQVTFTTPLVNTKPAPTSSGDFAFPSAGWFALGVNSDGAVAANSDVVLPIRLEVRNA